MQIDDFLKKVAFLGLGTATATKEKIEEGVKKLIAKGEITAAQGEKIVKKWLQDADKASKELGKKIDTGVNKALDKAGVVRKKDVDALERRITRLERAQKPDTRKSSARKSTGKKK